MKKDYKKIVRVAKKAGWRIRYGRHLRLYPSDASAPPMTSRPATRRCGACSLVREGIEPHDIEDALIARRTVLFPRNKGDGYFKRTVEVALSGVRGDY